MAKITLLKQGSENIYPLVHIDGVVDGNGNDISTLLDLKQDTLVSGTNVKTINSTSLLGSGDIAVATPTDLATYCPIIEDTRQSAVAAITGVAPFASLVDGQRIVVHFAYKSANNSTLTLTLSGDTTTGAIPIYRNTYNNISQLGGTNVREGSYYTLIYQANPSRWWIVGGVDTNTTYNTMTQAEINAGTQTGTRVITPKILCGNFQKHTAIVSSNFPASFAPNVMYNFGKVSTVNFSTYDTTKEISGCVNLYMFTFTVASGGTTVTLNANIKYPNGDDGTDFNDLLTEEDRVFECTIRDNKLTYVYFD